MTYDSCVLSCYTSGDFRVVADNGTSLKIKDIQQRTTIFCPVHEVGDGHSPSDFVDVDATGRHRIFCIVCSNKDTGGLRCKSSVSKSVSKYPM
jgi:hypothetical protein